MTKYDHKAIEKKWQEEWEKRGVYQTRTSPDKSKYYILDMFPYPSGDGLHIGHPRGYVATDVFARMKMMQGFNVLHPMGWDAFGLPTENYAIKNKVHPRKATEDNINTFKSQLKRLGFTYDWEREINTTDPGFYKWTQWIFLQMFKKGLAYESYEPINWCPGCKTGLANEDLEGGKCERCDSEIEQKPMRQWVLKITDYADRLLDDIENLNEWDESIKEMQKNWIGRSYGAKVKFLLRNTASRKNAELTQKDAEIIEDKLLYGDLTYKIQGACFDVNKSVGLGHKENVYHKALEDEFKRQGIHVESEKQIDIFHNNKKVGVYSPDFVLDDKVIVELKALPKIGSQQLTQVWTYLKGSPYKLALLVNYSPGGLDIRRLVYDSARTTSTSVENNNGFQRNSASVPQDSATSTSVEVFTTRPDTLFGATYFVLAPEHPVVKSQISNLKNEKEVEAYIEKARKKTEMERTELAKEKTGVKLEGVVAINPVNGEEIPVFVADYVMMHYGTGAIMAVPAHDERDYEFARKFGLEVREVVAKETGNPNGEEEEKRGGCAIVFDSKRQKYAVIRRSSGMFGFYSGGANQDESLHEAVQRELKEESGFHKFQHVENLAHAYTNYYNSVKKYRVRGLALCNLVVLESDDKVPLELEDHETDFETVWVTPDELMDNWQEYSHKDGSLDHWRWFLRLGVARLKELGIDKQEYKYAYEHEVFTGDGKAVNSDFLNGLPTPEAKEKMIQWLEENDLGKRDINYKLKDWVFSRQRYWGEPIPLVHCEKCGVVPVPEEELPLELPDVDHYEPTGTGESPLANITDWVNTTCPQCEGPGKRETNTMPQWAGSSWYYLRFIDPDNDKALVDKDKEKYWSPVDFYVGGAEHATRHLIYARFWHKFLYDIGAVNYNEPFKRLQHVGIILAEDGRKMSKRWGNVINPDEIVEKYGADAMRVYEMFMGPFSQSIAWSTNGLVGARKFLEKVWSMSEKVETGAKDDPEVISQLHKTIKKVGEDIEGFKLNTAVSAMMILANKITEKQPDKVSRETYQALLRILSPFAPHLCDELWSALGEGKSIFEEKWPEYDPKLIQDQTIELVLQVNGKVRDRVEVPANIAEAEAKERAMESEAVQKWIQDKEVVKAIFVPGKLVNIVVK